MSSWDFSKWIRNIDPDIDPEESINVLKSGNLTRDQILSNYKDVFEGLGHIGDTTIITDPSVKPVQHVP